MWPDDEDLDEEIRGHLALSVKERIQRGEDPESARLAALKEFGNVLRTRDSMRSVWRPRWLDAAEALGRDVRFALRSLLRAKGLAATVVVTLALGIGAIVVTLLLYSLFKPVNRNVSLVAAAVSLSGLSLGILNMLHLAPFQLSPLVLFGISCLLIGYLVFRSTFMPRALGVLMMVGGVG